MDDPLSWKGEATGEAAAIVAASLSAPTFRCAWGKGWLYRAYVTYQGRLWCVLTYYVGDAMKQGRATPLRGDNAQKR